MNKMQKTVYLALRKLGISQRKLNPDTYFQDDLEHFEVLYFVNQLEFNLGINIPDRDIPKLSSVRNTLWYLSNNMQH